MVRRTKEEAAATREHLLDTAEQVFLARGVSRASLLDIAAAAGLTRGAIYWHFKDKAELFLAMLDRIMLPCEAASCDLTLQAGGDFEQMLRQAVLQPLQRLCADERTRRVFTVIIHRTEYGDDMLSVRTRHLQAIADWTAGMATLLRSARQQRLIHADVDPDLAARGLFALVDGLLSQATLASDPATMLAAGEQAVSIFLAGLRADRTA
ncbi:transcriptional regulator, TetR family [Leptothrix cholodnii SP-6]|uniref:Transcriptional regulator, TetR family n=1 Tax=Leptothrix cholodnii (strain ATCC 51168 / LMG 8142 / SP-6) TaxID=395495 RepID=B1Y5S3_LEPCP|nr:TetR family transcriptional regulator [Leptothrix cholodnii]ACB35969.1 transcriptional regulator, TetR family [Leptothrix cholodnii SP-6]